MPHFIPVLVATILLFAGLMLVFGGLIITPSTIPAGGGGTAGPELQHIPLGNNFTVGYISAEQNVASVSGTVSQGLFSGEDRSYNFIISKPESVTGGHVNVHVDETNGYGRLVVSVNGRIFYREYAAPGDHVIPISADAFSDNNLLQIKAESSGWRFWAPTMYKLKANASVSYSGSLSKTFNFTLSSDEVALSTKGRLIVNVQRREGTGQLIAKLNGDQVYADVKTNIVKDFSPSSFAVGLNTLEISAPAGTRYSVASSELIIYFT